MTSEIFTFKQIDKDPYLSSHFGIYQISNTSGKYIGSTGRSFKKRLQDHICCLRNNKHHSRYLQHSYNKHSEDSLSISILEEMSETNRLLEREQYWIDTLQPEFNCCPVAGSNLGIKYSEEVVEKNRKSARNRKNQSNNTSGCVGVDWKKSKQQWRASIGLEVKSNYDLGYFDTFEEAVQARKKAEGYFWSDKFESKSKEDQLKILQLYREERYLLRDGLQYNNTTGERHIAFYRNRYVVTIRSKKINNRSKTLEEAIIVRDNYIANALKELKEDINYGW
jgi:group I intron endonuclease